VSVPAVPAGGLSVVRVSREGTRIALVAGTGAGARLYVGAIARSPTGSVQAIDGLHEVLPDLTGVRDVAWLDADTLVALGARGDQPELPMLTSTDGFEVDAGILPLRDLGTVAAAPAGSKLPIVAGSNSGQLYMWDVSFTWQPLGAGRDPAYPG
jgi:hypothetical protein